MKAIYEPKGAAAEYARLACNLYRGCAHGCTYCYAPSCLRMDRAEFHASPEPRPGILDALAKDAKRLAGDPRPILLCFTTDPYQPIEAEYRVTRQALRILAENRLRVKVLTKNPILALEDFPTMHSMGAAFGVSLVWADDSRRAKYEPNAGTVKDRIDMLAEARARGVVTWVSMEPVIEPEQALAVLWELAGNVGSIKIGKINHNASLEYGVDWRDFTINAAAVCVSRDQPYYIKDDLWREAGQPAGVVKEWGPAELWPEQKTKEVPMRKPMTLHVVESCPGWFRWRLDHVPGVYLGTISSPSRFSSAEDARIAGQKWCRRWWKAAVEVAQ